MVFPKAGSGGLAQAAVILLHIATNPPNRYCHKKIEPDKQ
jgi:hypothetical protein